MKIKDVIISEAPSQAFPVQQPGGYKPPTTDFASNYASRNRPGFIPNVTTTQPAAPAADKPAVPPPDQAPMRKDKAPAKIDPVVQARQKELIAAGAKIKADGIMGPKTRQAEKEFGPKVDAAKGSQTPGTATTITNPAQANQNAEQPAAPSAAPAAAPAPAKDNIDSATAAVRSGQNIGGAVARDAAATNALSDFQRLAGMTPTPQASNTAPTSTTNVPGLVSATTPQGSSENPQGQSAQSMKTAQDFAGTPQSVDATAPELKSGTGQTWKDSSGKAVKSSSDDELAWVAKNGGSFANRSLYPGPGNWDPKTGRTVKKDAQGNIIQDKGLGDRISDFFGGFGKQSSGQAAQPATGDQSGGSTTGNKAFLPGAAGGAKEDIDLLRKLSGLK